MILNIALTPDQAKYIVNASFPGRYIPMCTCNLGQETGGLQHEHGFCLFLFAYNLLRNTENTAIDKTDLNLDNDI